MAMNMADRPPLNDHDQRTVGMPRRGAAGFTMVEMLVVLVILVILTAMAAPAFTDFIASMRASGIASELYAALARARNEAIGRNVNVTLSPKTGGWKNGWQIVDPANASNVLDDRGVTTGVSVSGPNSVIYQGTGRVQGGSTSFLITASGSTVSYQCVAVDLGGRPYMVAASSC